MADDGHSVTGFPMRGTLLRQRPWVSDAAWIAHESLPGFAPLASRLTHRGLWNMTKEGPIPSSTAMSPDLDLGGFIHDAAKRSAPAVVEPSDLEMASDFDGLTDELLDQVIHVIDPTTGTAWAFNHAAVYVASTGAARWTWHIAPPLSSAAATLIGVDHKERPRFAIANVIIAADGPPVIA